VAKPVSCRRGSVAWRFRAWSSVPTAGSWPERYGDVRRCLLETIAPIDLQHWCAELSRVFDEQLIQWQMLGAAKPLVLTEGDTDPTYIRAALGLLGGQDLLSALDIRAVGQQGKQGSINAGVNGLNHTRNLIEAHPDLLKQPVMLLYDCDSRKPPVQAIDSALGLEARHVTLQTPEQAPDADSSRPAAGVRRQTT
jgi:hypothetical protein